MVEDAVELHVFVGGQLAVEAGVLEDDAEALARFVLAARTGSRPSSSMGPPVGLEQRGEHLDGGGFAGAVGAEEGEDLALRHFERKCL